MVADSHLLQRAHIVEAEPFNDTFGPKAQRKRPKLDVGTFEELSKAGTAAIEAAEGDNSQRGASGIFGFYISRSCVCNSVRTRPQVYFGYVPLPLC